MNDFLSNKRLAISLSLRSQGTITACWVKTEKIFFFKLGLLFNSAEANIRLNSRGSNLSVREFQIHQLEQGGLIRPCPKWRSLILFTKEVGAGDWQADCCICLHCFFVVKTEPSKKPEVSNYQLIHISTFIKGHELWVVGEKNNTVATKGQNEFLCRTSGLRIKPFWVESSQIRWSEHVVRMAPP